MIGKSLLHYKILAKLGEGGMGVVYQAEDTKLKRRVAIKFLPRRIAASDDERERFAIEAQAAAALNHNNIATIYNIEEAEGETFIVMEYIKGRELKERIAEGRIPVDEVLSVATQIAEGLQAAHEEGVVHRDIKSANIMLTHKGVVKIMDFGLAKMGGSIKLTKAGTTLGTAAYMSPEQARGEEADQRSDIWAFGVVLYEMLTGKYPFVGDYEQAIVYDILNEEPEKLTEIRAEAAHFQIIIDKALTKGRDARYHTMAEVLADLRGVAAGPVQGVGSGETTSTAQQHAPGRVGAGRESHGKSRKPLTIGLALAAVLLLAITILWKTDFLIQESPRPFQNMQLTRLTSTGRTAMANISPDGNYIVHALYDENQSSLWVRQIATGSDVEILPPAEVTFWGTTFSHDGNYIYYTMSDRASLVASVFRIPTLGGVPQKIIANVIGGVTLSPDERQIAFVRQFSEQGEEVLMLANVDGSNVRKLAVRKEPEFYVGSEPPGPTWSPDGKWIAVGAGSAADQWRSGVLIVSIRDGEQRWLFAPNQRLEMGQAAWTPGGRNVIFVGADTTSSARFQIWQASFPGGDLSRVTNDLNSYEPSSLGITADGDKLVGVKVDRISNIWAVPGFEASRAVQLTYTIGTDEGFEGLNTTLTGQVVFCSIESGNKDLWIMDVDGKNKRQLTMHPSSDEWPSVSGDGQTLVFSSDRGNLSHIWKKDLISGEVSQLTSHEDYGADISRDGKWVAYYGFRPGGPDQSGPAFAVRKIAIDGGVPIQLTDKPANSAVISPDGKYVACRYQDEPGGPSLLAILSIEGGPPLKKFSIPQNPPGAYSLARFVWTPDSRAVMFVDPPTGVSNIMRQPIAGGDPEKVTDFKTGTIFNFAVTDDGRSLVCARGSVNSDVVLIQDIQ